MTIRARGRAGAGSGGGRGGKPPLSSPDVVSWAGGPFVPPVPADVFKKEWDRISKAVGHEATAEDIVAAARNPRNPLHECFDWDIKRAAMARWVATASRLIGHLRVTFSGGGTREVRMRAIVSVRTETGRNPKWYREALDNDDWRRQLLEQAAEEIRVFTKKYVMLLTAANLTDRADALLQGIEAILERDASM